MDENLLDELSNLIKTGMSAILLGARRVEYQTTYGDIAIIIYRLSVGTEHIRIDIHDKSVRA